MDLKKLNLDLFVGGMGAAARAELLDGELFRLPLFVSRGRVVAPFARVALHPNQVSHRCNLLPPPLWRNFR
jgi:hypothetical protein